MYIISLLKYDWITSMQCIPARRMNDIPKQQRYEYHTCIWYAQCNKHFHTDFSMKYILSFLLCGYIFTNKLSHSLLDYST